MNRVAPLALLALVAVTTASNPTPMLSSAQAHVIRHLNAALHTLSERDLSAFSAVQLRNRAKLIEALVLYRNAGAFPQNRDFANEYRPYFVDPRSGAVCAVGHLMEFTGYTALVARIAAVDNHVRVSELAGDAEVVAWLEENGVSLDEAARIQPSYGFEPQPEIIKRPMMSRTATTGLSVVSGALSLLTLLPASPRLLPATRIIGLATSATSIVAGADFARLNQHRGTSTAALVSGGIGVGVALGSWYYTRKTPTRSESRWRVTPATDGRQFLVSVQRR